MQIPYDQIHLVPRKIDRREALAKFDHVKRDLLEAPFAGHAML